MVKKIKHNSKTLSAIPPYHLFRVFQDYFVFDTTGCRFYKIDELVFDFLFLIQTHPRNQIKKCLRSLNKYSEEDILNIVKEISFLRKHGLFDQINTYINLHHAKKEMKKISISGMLQDAQLLLAETCNLACTYCYCPSNLQNGGIMTESIAKGVINLLLEQKIPSVNLTMFGGEPLLNKSLIDFIMKYSKEQMALKQKKLHYIITTNATLLDDKIIDYIVNDNFGLMVSLDGPRELHNRQCPTKSGEGSYDLAIHNIKKMMQRRTVGVRATLAHPLPNLKDLVDFFVDFGFDNIVIGIASNRQENPGKSDLTKEDINSLINQEEELLPCIKKFLEEGKRPPYFSYERWYSAIKDAQIYPYTHLFNCGAGSAICGVDSHGYFYPCAKFCGMKKWQIGDVSHGIDYKKSKNMWLRFIRCIKPKCGKCWAYPLCHGPCIWECAQNDGTFKFSDKYCNLMKKNIERSAYLYFHTQECLDQQTKNTVRTTESCLT